MITKEYLAGLSHEEKDAMSLRQAHDIEKMKVQIQELSDALVKLIKSKKASKNLGAPPSKDQKENRPEKEKKVRKKRLGGGFSRALHDNSHETKDIKLEECSCGTVLSESQTIYQEFNHIDIPDLETKVARYRLHKAKCPHCKKRNYALVPEDIDAYMPFEPDIQNLLFYNHFVSYIRLKSFCSDVLKFDLSEGAIANLLKYCKGKIDTKVEGYKGVIRQSSVVESDETSARVNGKNWWEWVFHNDDVAFHVIRPSRSAQVVKDVL